MNARHDDVSWSLFARAAAGDGVARSVFSRSYLPVVRSFLAARWRGLRLANDIDDAVQEVFLECLRENGVLARGTAERGDVRGLLFGVTRKVAARFEERAQKQHRRDRGAGSFVESIAAREASLSRLFDREWARMLMRIAGDRMCELAESGSANARLRVELLRLRFGDGKSIREIADLWAVDPAGVHRAYAKAREEFRACLRQVVVTHMVRMEADLEREVERLLDLIG